MSRSTMCGWIRAGASLVEPVVLFMKREILRSLVVATDETPLLVLDRAGGGTFKGRIRELGCLHCRRYFVVAAEVDPVLPMQALGMIRVLYRVEAAWSSTPEERFIHRQQHAVPVLDRLEEWLERMAPVVLPKSPLGDAIRYARNQWKVLRRYTEDGRFEADNGWSERALRLVAINRKNRLFAGAEDGGRWPRSSGP